MIKIYSALQTRSSWVLWVLEEAGAEYEFIHIELDRGEGKQELYLQLNSTGI
jgi:glutathione S-transferase